VAGASEDTASRKCGVANRDTAGPARTASGAFHPVTTASDQKQPSVLMLK